MNGYLLSGASTSLMAAPEQDQDPDRRSPSSSGWSSSIRFETETARFWENHGEFHNDSDPKADPDGGLPAPVVHGIRRGRGLASPTPAVVGIQWHWKAVDEPPGESRSDIEIIADPAQPPACASTPRKAAPSPIPIVNTALERMLEAGASRRQSRDLLKEINGYAIEDLPDPARSRPKTLLKRRPVARRPSGSSCATTARHPAPAGSTPAVYHRPPET